MTSPVVREISGMPYERVHSTGSAAVSESVGVTQTASSSVAVVLSKVRDSPVEVPVVETSPVEVPVVDTPVVESVEVVSADVVVASVLVEVLEILEAPVESVVCPDEVVALGCSEDVPVVGSVEVLLVEVSVLLEEALVAGPSLPQPAATARSCASRRGACARRRGIGPR